jgi:transposase
MPEECPMCGETMRLATREHTDRVPGTAETHLRQDREWTCPECDYFEEAAENGADE